MFRYHQELLLFYRIFDVRRHDYINLFWSRDFFLIDTSMIWDSTFDLTTCNDCKLLAWSKIESTNSSNSCRFGILILTHRWRAGINPALNQAWDYSFQRRPSDIICDLADHFLPTPTCSGHCGALVNKYSPVSRSYIPLVLRCHAMLLRAFHPVSLASCSRALTPYATSFTNQLHLASFVGLGYLSAQAFDTLHIASR